MPQMYPISWVLIFVLVELMLVLSFLLMSHMISINKMKISDGTKSEAVKNFWLW